MSSNLTRPAFTMKIKELFTLPNLLTFARLVLIPFFALQLLRGNNLQAVALLVIMIITDILDGHFARKRNLVTTFGSIFDLSTDTLFIFVGLVSLVVLEGVTLLQFVLIAFGASLQWIGLYLIYFKKRYVHSTLLSKLDGISLGVIFFWYLLGIPYLFWYTYAVIAFTILLGVKRNVDGIQVLLRA